MKRLISLLLLLVPAPAFATGYGGDEVVVQSQAIVEDDCAYSGACAVEEVVEAVPIYSAPVITGMAQVYQQPVVVRQQVVRQRQVYQQPVVVRQRVLRQQYVAAAPVYGGGLSQQIVGGQQQVVVQQRRGLFGRRRQQVVNGGAQLQIQGSNLGRGTRIRARIR